MDSFYSKMRYVIPEDEDEKKLHKDHPKLSKKTEPNRIECSYCFDSFTSPEELILHKRTRHHATKQYICKWCNIAVSYRSWNYHYQKHTVGERYSCESCNKKFITVWHLRSHRANHKYSCSFCDQSFVFIKQIRSHLISAHNIDEEFIPCVSKIKTDRRNKSNTKCGKLHVPQEQKPTGIDTFTQYSKTPARKSSGVGKTFVCDKCNCKFPKLILWRDHIKKHVNCRPYSCNDCNSKFVQKKMLEKHVRQHLYRCQECSKSFSCKNYYDVHCYNKHMRNIGPDPNPDLEIKIESMVRCQYCGLFFINEEELRSHIRMTGENLIVCAHCLEIFEEEYEFSCHLKIEHDIDAM